MKFCLEMRLGKQRIFYLEFTGGGRGIITLCFFMLHHLLEEFLSIGKMCISFLFSMPFAKSNHLISRRIFYKNYSKVGKIIEKKIKLIVTPSFLHFKTNQCSSKDLCYSSKTSKLKFLSEHLCAKPKWLLEVLSSQNLAKINPSFRLTLLSQ